MVLIMLSPDQPIKNSQDDVLKRKPLAKKVADLISGFKGKDGYSESFVVGIEGPWGSGKTSFMNIVSEFLLEDKNIVLTPFNPWNFTGQNELIQDFFDSVTESLKKVSTNEDLIKSLLSYTKKLKSVEIDFAPSFSLFGFFSFNLGSIKKFGGEKPLTEIRKDIEDNLKKLNKKIVVVIDDIDRLDRRETLLVLKLVKMTANFPNVVFVLLYDRDRVSKRINEDGCPGEEYLKKIVQVTLTLPQPEERDLLSILYADLDKSIESVYGEVKLDDVEEQRWAKIIQAGYGKLFKTVRDIKRYISSLRLNWSIVGKDDVNKVDFLAIEAIRVFAPVFYNEMADNQDFFSGKNYWLTSSYGQQNKQIREQKYKEMLELISDKKLRDRIDGITRELFPQIDFSNTHHGDSEFIKWNVQKRVCSSDKFGFYFQLGVPTGAISDIEITALLNNLAKNESIKDAFEYFKKEKKIRQVLRMLVENIVEKKLDETQLKNLVESIWENESLINDTREAVFDFDDVETLSSRILYQGLLHIVPENNREDFLLNLIKTNKGFVYPIKFVAMCEQAIREEKRDFVVKGTNLDEMKKIALEKIETANKQGSLLQSSDLVLLLYRWKDWGGIEKVKNFINPLLENRDGFFSFLKGFKGLVLSSNGNYYQISKKAIYELYGDEKGFEAIKDKYFALTDLTADEKSLVEIYNHKSRWD